MAGRPRLSWTHETMKAAWNINPHNPSFDLENREMTRFAKRQYPLFHWFFHVFFAAAAPTVHICLCMMVTAPIVASTALSLVPKAPASSVCFALWVTKFQQLCRHGTLRKGTVGQSEFLQKVGMLSTLECCWAASWMYAEQNSGEHWLCTLPRKPVARTSPQDQSAGAVARTSCQMCSSGNIMPKANLLRAQSITKPQSLRKVLSARKAQGCFQAARLRVLQFFRIVPAACFGLLKAVGCRFRSQLECWKRGCLSNGSSVDGLDAKLQHH